VMIYCKIVIIRFGGSLRIAREDPRLSLYGGKTSPDGGGRIYCKIVIIQWEDLSGLWWEDPRL
jgi:hypothetical protein